MQVTGSKADLQEILHPKTAPQITLGFVPTMGALHAGHLSLVKRALSENERCVVSIFVNPTQFNQAADLDTYPRTLESDLKLLEEAGCDVVFTPTVEEMYPQGARTETYDLQGLDVRMEGAFRAGHFQGVATVVAAFFEMVQPTRAYFGEKDYQQLRIIQTLADQHFPSIEIVGCPIERSPEGLALSSRNARLTEDQRTEALHLYQTLHWMREQAGKLAVPEMLKAVEQRLANTPLELEYVEVADARTLLPVRSWDEAGQVRAFLAAYLGDVRLIDNTALN